ncbi:MAG: hypothetical protein SFW36_03945 [Leptolyngbyaceae cyanobacterium bins.59]|nr:hypothetical protein [Leptolyngbyaceae cyanobacterium bins.59]
MLEPPPTHTPHPSAEPGNPATISKTVLKLAEPTFPEQAPTLTVAEPIATAMLHLIDMVNHLRSPGSGWPANLEQTPQNLAPYVLEEAYEVWSAVQNSPVPILPLHSIGGTSQEDFLQHYCSIEQLAPRLLWSLARTSYDIMQLVGGIPGQVCKPGESWQSGMLRLVPVLEVKTPIADCSLDLVTHSLSHETFLTDQVVRSEQGSLCPAPIWGENLLQSLTRQVQAVAPDIALFMAGAEADLLVPGQPWQAGVVRLRLHLEFTPEPRLLSLPGKIDHESQPPSITEFPLRLTDPTFLQQVTQELLIPQLISFLTLHPLEALLDQEEEAIVEQFIHIAHHLVNHLHSSSANESHPLLKTDCLGSGWLPQWFWQLTRVSPELTQLMSGIPARVLQPQQDWETGLLRLLAMIHLTIDGQIWVMDLATGHLLDQAPALLNSTVVVQSRNHEFCQEPERIEVLFERLDLQMLGSISLLPLLRRGCQIECKMDQEDWQSGFLQLHLGFHLYPLASTYP